jgi:mRNA interferase MazF
MSFSRGDVLIALFPHADGSPPKARPVLVVQADAYNAKIKNLIVAAITSNLRHASDPASLLIDVTTPDGKASGLVQNSVLSCINLATIEDTLVAKKIGRLSVAMMHQVSDCLRIAFDLP